MIHDTSFAPYIRDKVIINRSPFRNQLHQAMITSKGSHSLMGHNGSLYLQSALKPSIGEFIERHSLLIHNRKQDELLTAFRLTTGDEIQIPAQSIVFIPNSMFTDSCGTASHLNSEKTIEKAFLEFFERQSLIYNWITASSGRKINESTIKSEKARKLYELLLHFLDEVNIFEISLHPYVNVVLGIGKSKYLKSVGLAADFTIDATIESALEEMIQGLSNSYNKHEVDYLETNSSLKHDDVYTENFYQLTPTELIDSFSYLFRNETEYEYTEHPFQLNEVVAKIEEDLRIQIFCALIPTFYKGVRTKIVKVFSPEGYPHMYPVEFKEDDTNRSFNKNPKHFPNAYTQIPFP